MRTTIQGLIIAATFVLAQTPGLHSTPTSVRNNYQGSHTEPPYVQVTAVTVDPTSIQATKSPKQSVVTVQIAHVGEISQNARVTVGLSTYSADPPENNAQYSPAQTVTIAPGGNVTVVRFIVRSSNQTLSGKLRIAADIRGVTPPIKVKRPDSSANWQADLVTSAP